MSTVCLVTGAAGFIGSHLSESLLQEGHRVIGLDCFIDSYSRDLKKTNLEALCNQSEFRFYDLDLCTANLTTLFAHEQIEVVFHEAAQAGVRASWGQNFAVYTQNNVLATQRLLEAARAHQVTRFVYASSSSVYGDVAELPISETSCPRPVSPYGVTKLAGEHLCRLYHTNFGLPTVSLRYFTVYGPRQRPDMAFHRFIRALLHGETLTLYDDGEQTRDFTFVADIVTANLLAMQVDLQGVTLNIGGASRVTLNQVLDLLGEIMDVPVRVDRQERQYGDVRHTWADTRLAERLLGYAPRWRLAEGLRAEAEWLRGMQK